MFVFTQFTNCHHPIQMSKNTKTTYFFLVLYEYETRFYTGIKLKMNICLKGEHSN